jgi:hypothetical protein
VGVCVILSRNILKAVTHTCTYAHSQPCHLPLACITVVGLQQGKLCLFVVCLVTLSGSEKVWRRREVKGNGCELLERMYLDIVGRTEGKQ